MPKVIQDPEEPDKEGRRLDGRNLIEEWSRNHRLRNAAAKYVANKEQFENVDPRKVNHLLGNEQKHVSTFIHTYSGGKRNLLAMNLNGTRDIREDVRDASIRHRTKVFSYIIILTFCY